MIKNKEDGFEGERRITVPPLVIDQYKENEIFKSLFITDIGYYPKAKHHFCKRSNGSNENILIHCVDGSGTVIIEDDKFVINANQFILIPANTKHTYKASKKSPWTIYWMHFDGHHSKFISNFIFNRKRKEDVFLPLNDEHQKLFDKIYYLLLQGYSKEYMMLISLSLPYFLSRYMFPEKFGSLENQKEEDIIKQSINYLKSNIDKKIILKDLADSVFLSVSHFSKTFKNKTGYSPIEYLNHLKIQKACSLLQFSEKRISQISYEIGFDDQYYFSRLFKQHMGVSPSGYRNNLKE